MKQIWTTQAQRIDAMSLRERAFMFVTIALALAGIADVAVLSPAFAERRQLTAQTREQAQQVAALRAQLATSGPDASQLSPQGRQRAAIERLREEQRAVDGQIRAQLASGDEVPRLPDVLDRVLRQHERLQLVSLTLAAPSPAATAPSVRWQGVDLGVAGSYPDLVRYLADLEQALPGLRWGPLQISSATSPPVLTVRLMLVAEAS